MRQKKKERGKGQEPRRRRRLQQQIVTKWIAQRLCRGMQGKQSRVRHRIIIFRGLGDCTHLVGNWTHFYPCMYLIIVRISSIVKVCFCYRLKVLKKNSVFMFLLFFWFLFFYLVLYYLKEESFQKLFYTRAKTLRCMLLFVRINRKTKKNCWYSAE